MTRFILLAALLSGCTAQVGEAYEQPDPGPIPVVASLDDCRPDYKVCAGTNSTLNYYFYADGVANHLCAYHNGFAVMCRVRVPNEPHS